MKIERERERLDLIGEELDRLVHCIVFSVFFFIVRVKKMSHTIIHYALLNRLLIW